MCLVNADVPPMEVITVDEHDPHVNPLGIKGVGEIGITGSAGAVANAVWHATGHPYRAEFPDQDRGGGDGVGVDATSRPTNGRRPGEGRDPYSAARVVNGSRRSQRLATISILWLWVPAFAGTTLDGARWLHPAAVTQFTQSTTAIGIVGRIEKPMRSRGLQIESCRPA